MGEIKLPKDVKLFTAVMFKDAELLSEIKTTLIQAWGSIEETSEIFDFIHSEYYQDEMGTGLKKQFWIFTRLVRPDFLPDAKLLTNQIEAQYLEAGKRVINLDPGYLSAAKLILATTKNYMHRIYLRDGIYGDVHLKVSQRRLVPNEWTYPDYKTEETLVFFNHVRKKYLELIQG